jgi:hypothetical protein
MDDFTAIRVVMIELRLSVLYRLLRCPQQTYFFSHITVSTSSFSFINIVILNGLPRDEVTGDLRKLHDEELHNLYSSPNIITMIKSRRMRWAGHVARMGAKTNAYRILVGSQKERDH